MKMSISNKWKKNPCLNKKNKILYLTPFYSSYRKRMAKNCFPSNSWPGLCSPFLSATILLEYENHANRRKWIICNRSVIETEIPCSKVSICSTWLCLMVRVLSIPLCSILVNICPGEMWWNVCPPVMCTGVTLLHLKNFYQFKFFQPVDHLHGKCQKLHKSSQKLLSLTKFSEFPYLLV